MSKTIKSICGELDKQALSALLEELDTFYGDTPHFVGDVIDQMRGRLNLGYPQIDFDSIAEYMIKNKDQYEHVLNGIEFRVIYGIMEREKGAE